MNTHCEAGNGPNNGNPRYRVSAESPADVDNVNRQMAAIYSNPCHTNCNSTESRFIWFRYSATSYPFIM